jgi:hypothetical protein
MEEKVEEEENYGYVVFKCLNWESPTPSPASECASPSPGTKWGVYTRLRVRGRASPNSDDWGKSF